MGAWETEANKNVNTATPKRSKNLHIPKMPYLLFDPV